ncbi:hypothetical protein BJY04DRAFT_191178 [Aspergillus karnatakaensis]|uniref:uncharacterized protein n=1 Tax=Aspergillus karnatakaensis TaxID=1810916 RepID=UPI003CCD1833
MRLLHHFMIGASLAANTVLATIELGQIETNGEVRLNIAWIAGDNPCKTAKYTGITANGENPCGVRFTLNNGYTYYEKNCGSGPIDIYNDDNSFNSHCQGKDWTCKTNGNTIRQTYTCF